MAAWWPGQQGCRAHGGRSAIRRTAGVVGVFQQAGGKAFLGGTIRRAHHAGQQPHAGIKQHQRGRLAAGQDVVADADFLHPAGVDHALVDALVAAAQQDHATCAARVHARQRWVSGRPRGVRQMAASVGDRVQRGVDHIGPHHHAGAAAEGRVVDGAVAIRRMGADVSVSSDQDARFPGAPGQRMAEKTGEHVGKQRQDGGAPDHRLRCARPSPLRLRSGIRRGQEPPALPAGATTRRRRCRSPARRRRER